MQNWTTYKLRDLIELKNGFAFKGTDFIAEGVPVIKIKNVKPGKILLNDLSYVSREVADKAKRFKISPDDILITMSGNRIDGTPDTWVGKVALFKIEGEYLLNQRVGILRVKDETIVSKNFISQLLSSNDFQQYFITNATSSGGQANISPDLIYNTEVTIPDIEEQNRIASIINSIDSKTEINSQISQSLEAMAQTVFKEWFINFRFPDFNGELDNGLPKGWKRAAINDIAKKVQYGYGQSASLENVGPKYLRITDIQRGEVNWNQVPYCVVDENDYEKYKIIDHDIFIARTGASTGENIYVINPPRAVFASYLIRVQFENPALSAYVGKFLRRQEYFNFISSILGGSAQPNANAQELTNIEIVVPTDDVLEKYFSFVNSINKRKENNYSENQTLILLRESLLPKLMSGKIEIPA